MFSPHRVESLSPPPQVSLSDRGDQHRYHHYQHGPDHRAPHLMALGGLRSSSDSAALGTPMFPGMPAAAQVPSMRAAWSDTMGYPQHRGYPPHMGSVAASAPRDGATMQRDWLVQAAGSPQAALATAQASPRLTSRPATSRMDGVSMRPVRHAFAAPTVDVGAAPPRAPAASSREGSVGRAARPLRMDVGGGAGSDVSPECDAEAEPGDAGDTPESREKAYNDIGLVVTRTKQLEKILKDLFGATGERSLAEKRCCAVCCAWKSPPPTACLVSSKRSAGPLRCPQLPEPLAWARHPGRSSVRGASQRVRCLWRLLVRNSRGPERLGHRNQAVY